MKQFQQVIEAMKNNGGYSTLGLLNQTVDVSGWKTKSPYASIRRIVQDEKIFFKIKPGLWALNEFKNQIFEKFEIKKSKKAAENFNHTYYQGLLVEIGNLKGFETYIPPQDKNKLFLEKPLSNIAMIDKIYEFTYPVISNRAKSIDVIWFNERRFPSSLFEIEHSTDIQNSLTKFCDLQDFYTKFYIVSSIERKREYEQKIGYSAFKDVKTRVLFIDYEFVSSLHSKMFELNNIGSL